MKYAVCPLQACCRIMPRFLAVCLLVACVACAGCAGGSRPGVSSPVPESWQPQGYPQDLNAYLAALASPDALLLDSAALEENNALADQRMFAPWRQTRPSMNAKTVAPYGIAEGRVQPRGYAENLQPWSEEHWRALAENCNMAAFPSLAPQGVVTGQIGDGNPNSAIITRTTSMRVLPTIRPMFLDPAKAGQGYPFDMLQNAVLWIGTPVYVSHSSADGAWLFCETGFAGGWVRTLDVAFTDAEFRNRYESGRYAAIVKDAVPLRNYSGRFLDMAYIGTILPVARFVPGEPLSVLVPGRGVSGMAGIEEAPVADGDGAVKPLPMTARLVAELGNRMMGQPYGWGGLYENRDCSAAMRDLFLPFGIWLPGYSGAQGKAYAAVRLADQSPDEKEQGIRQHGVPFGTLVWMPGHIGLYVGQWQGRAAMFHVAWGLRTMDEGVEGRLILGRALVTSLTPGDDVPQRAATLLERVGAVVRVGMPRDAE